MKHSMNVNSHCAMIKFLALCTISFPEDVIVIKKKKNDSTFFTLFRNDKINNRETHYGAKKKLSVYCRK